MICDLDGTLLSCSSEKEFLIMLLRKGAIPFRNQFRFLLAYLLHPVRTLRQGRGWNRTYLRGLTPAQVDETAKDLVDRLAGRIRPEVLQFLVEAGNTGARLHLLSASLEPLVREVALRHGFDHFSGSVLRHEKGVLTGEVSGPRPWGEAKAELALRLMKSLGVDPEDTTALGDSLSDRPLMEMCGRAIAVHPEGRMRKTALINRWELMG